MMLPADLNVFWQRTREALQQTPMHATLTIAPEHSEREYVTYGDFVKKRYHIKPGQLDES